MFRKNSKNIIYLFLVILPFLLFFVWPRSYSTVKSHFIDVSTPAIRFFSFPLREIKKILYYHRTFEEYKRLRGQVDELKARLIGLEEVIRENTRLEELLAFKRRLIYSSVAAKVIGRDPSRWNASLIIDKGLSDGLRQDLPVVNAKGVIGKIAEVHAHTSKVILLTDPQFSVAALVRRPGESGLVSGTLQGTCRMTYLNPSADIRKGDQVITSQLSSSFPESLLIGHITQIHNDPETQQMGCTVEPAVSFSQIEEVLVILE